MSSAYIKAKLKESRDAIQKKQWEEARQAAANVVEEDKSSYNGYVFLGLALLNLEQFDESEKAYLQAIELQPTQPLAFQGLEKFYEQRQQGDQLITLLLRQADLALDNQDAHRCAECVQRVIEVERKSSNKAGEAWALALTLPGSRYHDLFVTSLERAQPTEARNPTIVEVQMSVSLDSYKVLQTVIALTEDDEREVVEREVQKKRMRLEGAGKSKESLQNEAGLAVWPLSKLPTWYEQLLAHSDAPDEARREAEGKLLRYLYRLLLALPTQPRGLQIPTAEGAGRSDTTGTDEEKSSLTKAGLRNRVADLVKGMVIVEVPDELAWSLHLDWQDFASLADVPRNVLRSAIRFFPRSGRAQAYSALLLTLQDEQYKAEVEEIDKNSDVDRGMREQDPLTLALAGLESAPQSHLVCRIAACLSLLDRDYSATSQIAASAIERCQGLVTRSAVNLSKTIRDINYVLGASLCRIHASQNHAKALRLLDEVLESQPTHCETLFARGYIEMSAARWESAQGFYRRILQQSSPSDVPHNAAARHLSNYKDPITAARGNLGWCAVKLGRLQEGLLELEEAQGRMDNDHQRGAADQDFTDEDRADAWWRQGECLVGLGIQDAGEDDVFSRAFDCYVTALKRCPSFAPAFASLGRFYERHSSPADRIRSTKCYQKALELDATQFEAALQLATHYADEREWDLVSMIASRVVEGEGGSEALHGQQVALQQKHKSQNAWAWKAIGIVRLEQGDAQGAVTPLQVALRTNSADAVAWQRLGEAYLTNGRHTAALKAFERVLQLEAENWEAQYSIAEVYRQLDDYEAAMLLLNGVLISRPEVLGIRVALGEVHLSASRHHLLNGFVERSQESLYEAVRNALEVLDNEALLRSAWKIASDAAFDASKHVPDAQILGAFEKLWVPLMHIATRQNVDNLVPSVDSITATNVPEAMTADAGSYRCAMLTAAAYLNKLRVALCASSDELVGSAWAELSITLVELATYKGVQLGDRHFKQAVSCIKEALNHEPANDAFWLVLGNLTFQRSIKVAQHAYIRAIESSVNDPVPWCNLGLLYLKHQNTELAAQCFVQAQTLDPEHPVAWFGQALLASHYGDHLSAKTLCAHAVEVSGGALLDADCHFGAVLFEQQQVLAADVHSASFALASYLSHRPEDPNALHLAALYAEQLGEYSLASRHMELVAWLLEAEFEKTESAHTALKFAIAQSNLARIRLGSGNVRGAQEASQTALSLLQDENHQDHSDNEDAARRRDVQRLRAQQNALMTSAVAHTVTGDFDAALRASTLPPAIHQSDVLSHAQRATMQSMKSVAQAQILCAAGREDEAKSILLAAVEDQPASMDIAIVLSTVALLDADMELFTATITDINDQGLQPLTSEWHPQLRQLEAGAAFLDGEDGNGCRQLELSISAARDDNVRSGREKQKHWEEQLRISGDLFEARARLLANGTDADQTPPAEIRGVFEAVGNFVTSSEQYSRALRLLCAEEMVSRRPESRTASVSRHAVLENPGDYLCWRLLQVAGHSVVSLK
ncbi:unnamed protein product [Jaminaea pallidilutea]